MRTRRPRAKPSKSTSRTSRSTAPASGRGADAARPGRHPPHEATDLRAGRSHLGYPVRSMVPGGPIQEGFDPSADQQGAGRRSGRSGCGPSSRLRRRRSVRELREDYGLQVVQPMQRQATLRSGCRSPPRAHVRIRLLLPSLRVEASEDRIERGPQLSAIRAAHRPAYSRGRVRRRRTRAASAGDRRRSRYAGAVRARR